MVPLAHVAAQRVEEILRRAAAGKPPLELLHQAREQDGAARDEPGLGQGGARVQVAAGDGRALGRRAIAVSDGQAGIPQQRERALHQGRDLRARVVGPQEEHVDVGAGGELPAAIAAKGDGRDLVLVRGKGGRGLGGGDAARVPDARPSAGA